MFRKSALAALCSITAVCGAFGIAGCAMPKQTYVDKPLTIQTAYTTAAELGYRGTAEEFSSQLDMDGDVYVVKVELNDEGELLVTLSNGTVTNMGVVDLSCNHTYTDWTVEITASCTTSGLNVRECTKCGEKDYDIIQAAGHSIVHTGYNQSCHEYECSVCGYKQEEHTFNEDNTCTVCGYEVDYTLGLVYSYNEETDSYTVTDDDTAHNAAQIIVPALYKNKPVTAIGERAFVSCNAESIILPESLTAIFNYAFRSCKSLKSINIPDGVTEICDWAFAVCTNLENISMPKNLERIGTYAFVNCTLLKNFEIPDTVTEIGRGAFGLCRTLTEIVIPESVKILGESAFNSCNNLQNITLPETLISIGYNAFSKTAIQSIHIPASVTYLGSGLFGSCASLKEVTFGCEITAIPGSMFSGCSGLENFEIPQTVTEIGAKAFYNCSALTVINIPDGVTKIGSNAFYGCKALTEINIHGGITEIGEGAFGICTSLTKIVLHEGITEISTNALRECSGITELIIPESVTLICAGGLLDTDSLTEISYNGTKEQWKAIQKESGWKTADNIIKIL